LRSREEFFEARFSTRRLRSTATENDYLRPDAVAATLAVAVSLARDRTGLQRGTAGRRLSIARPALIAEITGSTATPTTSTVDIDNIRRRVVNIEKIRREPRWIPSTRSSRAVTYEGCERQTTAVI
jgi:hypothetical protein